MKIRLCDQNEAAIYIGVEPRYLQHDRSTTRTIPFVKINRLVRYDLNDLDKLIESKKIGGGVA